MLLLLAAAVALAAPVLTVQVVPDPQPPRPPVHRHTAGVVPVGSLSRTADPLAAPTWAHVAPAPALEPTAMGPATFAGRLRVATQADRLLVRVPATPQGSHTWLSLDPDGLRARWWTWHLAGDTSTQQCSIDGLDPTFPGAAPTASARCDPASTEVQRLADGGWLITVPWHGPQPLTSEATLMWSLDGPEDGTWMGGGRTLPHRMEAGRPLDLPGLDARISADPAPAGFRFTVHTPHPGPLAWRLVRYGRTVHAGTLEPVDGVATWSTGPVADGMLALQITAPTQGIPAAANLPLRPPDQRAFLTTPVHGGTLVIAYALQRPLPDAHLTLWTAGQPWAEATVRLPRGTGRVEVRLPDDAPDTLTVQLGDLLPPRSATWAR